MLLSWYSVLMLVLVLVLVLVLLQLLILVLLVVFLSSSVLVLVPVTASISVSVLVLTVLLVLASRLGQDKHVCLQKGHKPSHFAICSFTFAHVATLCHVLSQLVALLPWLDTSCPHFPMRVDHG